ncbi:MAG: DUF2461 domain-containing protein [Myxococcota bacterium]
MTLPAPRPCADAASSRFAGFSMAGLEALAALARDNTKATFDLHREGIDEGLIEPAKRFVTALATRLGTAVSPGIEARPRVDGSIFRLRRDTRFSKDKSPYKTRLTMFVWEGEHRKRSPGFYLSLSPNRVQLGVGRMVIDDLERYRKAVDEPRSGEALVAAITKAQRALPGLTLSEPALKRVPRGFDPLHPRARWLRCKVLHAMLDVPMPGAVDGPEFLDWTVDRFLPFRDLHRWFVANT